MRRRLTILTLLLALGGLPGAASASRDQESILMDSNELVKGSSAQTEAAVRRVRDLGITRLRVEISWLRVIQPHDRQKPAGFVATDPNSYSPFGWAPYDRLIRLADRSGIKVYVDVNGFAPNWATPGGYPDGGCPGARPEGRGDVICRVNARDFGDFVQAVGTRYDGNHGLPRVDVWSLYNEPNIGGWLAPQFGSGGTPVSPHIYRDMVYAGHEGLRASGHGNDEVWIGELAPRSGDRPERELQSTMAPLLFMREFFCLDPQSRPFTGDAARARGCGGSFREIPATGLAHHPYGLLRTTSPPPDRAPEKPDDAPLSGTRRMVRLLDRAASLGRVRNALPVWMTEYGFETYPDDRRPLNEAAQALYMMRAEYLSWRNPRIKSYAQYLLRDDASQCGGVTCWQTGLMYYERRKKKASWFAIQQPIQALRGRGGFRIWGMVRPQPFTEKRVQLEFKRVRSRTYAGEFPGSTRCSPGFRTVGPVFNATGRGYFVRPTSYRRGLWRFAWLTSNGRRCSPAIGSTRP